MKLLELIILHPDKKDKWEHWNYASIDTSRIIAILQDTQVFDGGISCGLLMDSGQIIVPRKNKQEMLEILEIL